MSCVRLTTPAPHHHLESKKNLFAAREFVDGVFCVIFDVRSLGFYPRGKEKEAPFNSQ